MKFSLATGALALLASLSLVGEAHAGSPIDTIAAQLTAQDLFTDTEDENGLDVFQAGNENWNDFDILFAAVLTDGSLVDAVTMPSTAVTLFAPNDLAFRELVFDLTGIQFLTEEGVVNAVVGAVMAGELDLAAVLTYHVIPARVDLANLPVRQRLVTLNGEAVLFQPRLSGSLIEVKDTLTEARNGFVLETDLDAGNSIIHTVSRVLLPSNLGG